MNRFLTTMPVAALIALLAGCGGSSPNIDNATNPQGTPGTPAATVSAADASTVSTGTAAAGVASDAGFAQLYQGGSALAWIRHQPQGEAIFDGSTAGGVTSQAVDGPGTPTQQSTVIIDGSSLAAGNDQTATGSFTFISDKLAPDGSALSPSWWHVQLSFDGQTSSFTVTNDDGGVAQITSGEMDLYIKDVTTLSTVNLLPGNWTRVADIYSVIPATNPLTVTITPHGGAARTSVISGIRHANQNITRSNDGITATRVDVHTVSGDASDLTTSIPSVASLKGVANGPQMNSSDGTPYLFTKWTHNVTLADKTTHTWVWDRWATFTITETKTSGTLQWATIASSAESQTIYITRDGTVYGPYNRVALRNNFGLVMDLTKAGESL